MIVPFTRIVEWKHATGQKHPKTTITREYPLRAENGMDDLYPIPRDENTELYNKYKAEGDKLKFVIFCGRLADYKYYNMDQVTARALSIFEKMIINLIMIKEARKQLLPEDYLDEYSPMNKADLILQISGNGQGLVKNIFFNVLKKKYFI